MKRKLLSMSAILLSALTFLTSCEMSETTFETESSSSAIVQTITSFTEGESDALSQNVETTLEETSAAEQQTTTSATTTTTNPPTTTTTTPEEVVTEYKDDMLVHFIDVDQGDSAFIELPNGESVLIDAGETDQADKVVTYIYGQGYDTVDYVIATHAHSDHIGGLPTVLGSFNISNFYMTSAVATTQIYEDMLNAADNSGADIHNIMAGDIILDEANLLIEAVAPKEIDEDEQNNNSIVIKLTYGNNKFLFTGDAGKSEEDGIWTNIKCDVLKVGHHGSGTSSSANFLKKVEPTYAVISCGMNNSYGHPDDSVLKRLDERNIDVYRTDIQGTIVFTANGKDISVNVKPSEYIPPVVTTTEQQTQTEIVTQGGGTTYVLNTNSMKIHYPDCSSVDDMKEENKAFTNDYEAAIAQGYKSCGRCKP